MSNKGARDNRKKEKKIIVEAVCLINCTPHHAAGSEYWAGACGHSTGALEPWNQPCSSSRNKHSYTTVGTGRSAHLRQSSHSPQITLPGPGHYSPKSFFYFSPKIFCLLQVPKRAHLALDECNHAISGAGWNGWSPPSHCSSHPQQYPCRSLWPTDFCCSGLASCPGLLLDLADRCPSCPDRPQPLDVSALQSFSTGNNAPHPTIDGSSAGICLQDREGSTCHYNSAQVIHPLGAVRLLSH